MKKGRVLHDLEKLSEQLSIEVIYDTFLGTGGICSFKGKRYIIINTGLPIEQKIALFISGLRNEKIEEIYLPPYLRNMIEHIEPTKTID